MACTTDTCKIRPLSEGGYTSYTMGLPLSIRLNPDSIPLIISQCVSSFVAVQKSTDKLVIVTIGDLLTPNPIIASKRTDLQNTVDPFFNGDNYQYPYSFFTSGQSFAQFGTYNPLYPTPVSGPITYNQVNAGFLYPYGYKTSYYDTILEVWCNMVPLQEYYVSWQNNYAYDYTVEKVGFTEAPMFATTAEIDAITTTTNIMIIGYEQLKQGDCGVKIDSVNTSYTFSLPGFTQTFPFNSLLSFTRRNPACGDPVIAKDKGAPILASIGGKWKIIGIVIGFNGATGYGSRIDYIANQLGIEGWDGSLKSFNQTCYKYSPELNGNELTTVPGLNNLVSFTESNIVYRQIGITNINLT